MLSDQRASTSHNTEDDGGCDHEDEQIIREVHALTPPNHGREAWGRTHSHQSSFASSMANTEGASSENFSRISRDFSALVLAGSSTIDHNNTTSSMIMSGSGYSSNININNLGRIREDELMEENNPLAIVADNNPLNTVLPASSSGTVSGGQSEVVTVQRVQKEEVEAKIAAWQNAKVAKISNRFKREDAIINGWENEQVQKANSCMKKVERKLEEKRAKALEKMQNEVAMAHRKAEERRASAEGKRGTKVAKVLEIANLMRAIGRAPSKRSFFKAV